MRVNTRFASCSGGFGGFARHPIRIRAPQARVLDRLVRNDGDVTLGGLHHDLQMMTRHHLTVVPLEVNPAILTQRFDSARIGNVTGLHAIDAEPLVKIEPGFELPFVVRDVGGGFMMTDQVHALALRIRRECFQSEIRIRLREAEGLAVREPVAIPAGVPAFDEHAAKAVPGGEVDVAARVGGRGAVLRT
jgi:hypothetical protein